VVRWRVNKWFL